MDLPTILFPADHIVPLELLDGLIPIGIGIIIRGGGEEHAEHPTIVYRGVEQVHLALHTIYISLPLHRAEPIRYSLREGG